MNPPNQSLRRTFLVAALPLLALGLSHAQPGGAPPSAAPAISEENFPHVIRVRTWAAREDFRRGDKLKIESVRGDRPRIEPGGTYLVQGTYTLGSAPSATLMLSLTSSGSGGRGPTSPTQRMTIDQGTGTFTLANTVQNAGELHVSFYFANPANPRSSSAQGGIYFENR
jgi:hypothetical protein